MIQVKIETAERNGKESQGIRGNKMPKTPGPNLPSEKTVTFTVVFILSSQATI